MERDTLILHLIRDAQCLESEPGYIRIPLPLYSEAIALLRKQESVEPNVKDETHYYCGACNKRLPLKQHPKYCYRCGHEVKWHD